MSSLQTFLRMLQVINGATPDRVRNELGCSKATIKRHVGIARELGCVIRYDPFGNRYYLEDAGPFDVSRIRRARIRRTV